MSLEDITNNENKDARSLISRVLDFGNKYIDYKTGLIGAGVMGSIVFGINYYDTHELLGASTAALKQGGYTFLFGGSVMRGCEYLATRIRAQTLALLASVIIPSVVSIGLTYCVHSIKGTPKPVESTMPTAALVIPATAI
jgi:hypothetical protein